MREARSRQPSAGSTAGSWRSVETKPHLYLMIVTTDDKVADALDELRPNKRRLAAVYNRWSHERAPGGGEAMVDCLRIFRLAVREGDERYVVIIAILHA